MLHGTVWSVEPRPDGCVWLCTEAGVNEYRDGKLSAVRNAAGDLLASSGPVFQDGTRFWYRTPKGGLHCSSESGVSWYTTREGLPSNSVTSRVVKDTRGNIWFGTSGGACAYDGDVFQTLNRDDGMAGNTVLCVFPDDDGLMWF